MENTILATLTLMILAALATCLVSALAAYLLQLDDSLVLDGAVHVVSTLPCRAVGTVDRTAHETVLSVTLRAVDRGITPCYSRRTALNMAFDALIRDMDLRATA